LDSGDTKFSRKFRPRSPAVVALLIQFASLSIITLFLVGLWQTAHVKLTLNQAILSQAVLTLFMTRWFNLAWWWCLIQPLFPFAIVLALWMSLPSYFYLALFLFLLVFYWSTYRTQVPYYPSTQNAWLVVEKLLPQDRAISFVDIGSGLGGLVIYLGNKRPESKFIGVEIAPMPWLFSYLRKGGKARNTQFLRSNYERMDFSEFDVIFAYLSPAAMSGLWKKAKEEMKAGSLLISYEFPIIGVVEDLSVYPENNTGNNRKMYVWYL